MPDSFIAFETISCPRTEVKSQPIIPCLEGGSHCVFSVICASFLFTRNVLGTRVVPSPVLNVRMTQKTEIAPTLEKFPVHRGLGYSSQALGQVRGLGSDAAPAMPAVG